MVLYQGRMVARLADRRSRRYGVRGRPTVGPWRIVLAASWVALCGWSPDRAAADLGYVSGARCAECHRAEVEAWRGSHHDRAMEVADEATVLGDFGDVRFVDRGTEFFFFRRDGKYFVRTKGPGGSVEELAVEYTFGVDPLQQYLLRLPGGRLQALTVAWDTRPAEMGGQRWFHLQPEEVIEPGDWLHWSGPFYNWNTRCASCHSTNLRKNYDLKTRTYSTEWSDVDVNCEACHGPGAKHVAWAQAAKAERSADSGLVALDSQRAEVETCAPCHSRRHQLAEPALPGAKYLDHFLEDRLSQGLYFADGQIEEEVYVYGSFLQSKMHTAGVRCTDCHEPHGLALRATGNALCGQCHGAKVDPRFPGLVAGVYDASSHHHHPAGSPGAQCVNCHMPGRTYMVIDDRRDHSFRLPRPDLSVEYGVPNPCVGCHADKDDAWAAAAVVEWFGPRRPSHWTPALAAGRAGALSAHQLLDQLAQDRRQPAIARATAVELLRGLGPRSAASAAARAGDAEPLVRAMAAGAFDAMPPAERMAALALLDDPVRAVRIEVARVLAQVPRETLTADTRAKLDRVIAEYRTAQQLNLDTPEAHLNLGLMHAALGELADARREYELAIEIGPYFIPAYVNLADLHRVAGRESEAEAALRRALERNSGDADLHHALGLCLVRQGRTSEGVESLRIAAEASPEIARYVYTYGVALHSTGKAEQALAVLQAAHERHPADAEILGALVGIHSERGELWDALLFARKLAQLMPDDRRVQAMVAALEAQAKRTPR